MRKSGIPSLLLATSLFATPFMVGCDKDAAKPGDKVLNQQEKTTTDTNGNSTTTDQKTVQHPDGTTTSEKQTNSQQTH
jgi:hypothetical protein